MNPNSGWFGALATAEGIIKQIQAGSIPATPPNLRPGTGPDGSNPLSDAGTSILLIVVGIVVLGVVLMSFLANKSPITAVVKKVT